MTTKQPIDARPHNLSYTQYAAWYQESIDDPETFWGQRANETLDWIRPWKTVYDGDLNRATSTWFKGGQLNVSANCIDRHLAHQANQTAIIWEGDTPGTSKHISYQSLHDHVCQLANALKARNIKKGDRVCIYMPMIVEAAYAMLACTRIGAIHCVVFGGFSAESLKERILDANCHVVITADTGIRGGQTIPLKANVDHALLHCPQVHTNLVIRHTHEKINWFPQRDVWYHQAVETQSTQCPPVAMDAEDPLFILYTSGSTGKPKGVLHSTAGYLLHCAFRQSISSIPQLAPSPSSHNATEINHTFISMLSLIHI